ncbi:50S ribosomal protein L28, partial [Campylobacter jejuni]|nr:50S ribosomal protein L28 [Campylobacter jejuni]EAL0952609.1 50S ribosomal protein L28 [Campylobacter coli]ECL8565910.1 50S ribosomal protein L28 [Campylobacter jejuni]
TRKMRIAASTLRTLKKQNSK